MVMMSWCHDDDDDDEDDDDDNVDDDDDDEDNDVHEFMRSWDHAHYNSDCKVDDYNDDDDDHQNDDRHDDGDDSFCWQPLFRKNPSLVLSGKISHLEIPVIYHHFLVQNGQASSYRNSIKSQIANQVLSMRWVDDVVLGAPWNVTNELLTSM